MKAATHLMLALLGSQAVLFVSCGQNEGNPKEAPSQKLKIVNGFVVDENQLPEVVPLKLKTTSGEVGSCTGTFINRTQVLTAAHCVLGVAQVKTLVNGKVVYATSASIHPDYTTLPSEDQSSADLGVLTFPNAEASTVRSLASMKRPLAGDEIAIAGYGNIAVQEFIEIERDPIYGSRSTGLTTFGGDGKKRVGFNTIDSVEGGVINFVGEMKPGTEDGTNAAAAQGDSGGPMLIKESDGKGKTRWVLVGVTSAGSAELSKDPPVSFRRGRSTTVIRQGVDHVKTIYVDLTSASSRRFLATAIAK